MNEIQKFMGKDSLTVSEAMRLIDNNQRGILFILNHDNKLLGCITDGDIRRFLLSGGKMEDAVIDAANLVPKYAKSADEAKLLYHKRNYIIIPIVGDDGTVIDLYNGEGREWKRRNPLNIPVVINAGGKGTRLDPFTRVLR